MQRIFSPVILSGFLLSLSACSGMHIFREENAVDTQAEQAVPLGGAASSQASAANSSSAARSSSAQSSSESPPEASSSSFPLSHSSSSTPPLDADTWKIYEHPVLGISFSYPASWGKPGTTPESSMTDLATIVSSYREQGAENLNAFGPWLSFTSGEKFTPSMHFVSDEYPGEYFPNGNALVYGPMDSFSALKDSGDICDEHFAFDHRPGYGEVLDEAWFDCSEGIRTVLLRTRTDYGQGVGVLYNYQLRVLGYARLQNGFFDHALITRFFGTIQVPREDLGLEDFLSHPQVGISSEAFWKARGEIAAFVESIRSFVPLPRPLAAWEEPEGEEPDIRAIRQYYHRIGTGDLQGAYDLTAPKKAGFETFRSWYQTAILARPRDFTMIEPRTYRYFVDYQDHNHDPVVYRVVAKITDTGIETLSSEMLKSDIVTHGDMAAYTRERLGKSGVILIDGDEEIIVEEGVAPDPTEDNIRAVHYLHPRFSASGRYFLYEVTGWEWHAFVIYDAQQRKIVLRYDGWGEPSFTPGESYVFSCAAAGMSAPNGFVYSTEDWTELFDATKLIEEEYARFECFYDVHTSAIHFTARRGFSDEEGGDEIVAEITFDTVKREAKRLR